MTPSRLQAALRSKAFRGLTKTGKTEHRVVMHTHYRKALTCTVNCPYRHLAKSKWEPGMQRGHYHHEEDGYLFVELHIPNTTFVMWIRGDLLEE